MSPARPAIGRRIFLVATEESGDRLGAGLMKVLRQRLGDAVEFEGVGGRAMTREGLHPLFPIEELSIMGFAAVVKQLPKILTLIRQTVEAAMKLTNVPREFSTRYLNEGFSGGEKKRMEILQLALQRPLMAILDETDSGLDIDALRVVANGVNAVAGPDMGVLIITHYQRILHLVQPSHVHVMYQGRIVREGGPELVDALEARGYGWITDEIGAAA